MYWALVFLVFERINNKFTRHSGSCVQYKGLLGPSSVGCRSKYPRSSTLHWPSMYPQYLGTLVDIDPHLIHISVESQLIFAGTRLGVDLSWQTLDWLSIEFWLSVGHSVKTHGHMVIKGINQHSTVGAFSTNSHKIVLLSTWFFLSTLSIKQIP